MSNQYRYLADGTPFHYDPPHGQDCTVVTEGENPRAIGRVIRDANFQWWAVFDTGFHHGPFVAKNDAARELTPEDRS